LHITVGAIESIILAVGRVNAFARARIEVGGELARGDSAGDGTRR
jgi:hypothetical protein